MVARRAREVSADVDAILHGRGRDQAHAALDHVGHGHRIQRQHLATTLDAGDVEHVVHQAQKMAARLLNRIDGLRLVV